MQCIAIRLMLSTCVCLSVCVCVCVCVCVPHLWMPEKRFEIENSKMADKMAAVKHYIWL